MGGGGERPTWNDAYRGRGPGRPEDRDENVLDEPESEEDVARPGVCIRVYSFHLE